MFIKLIEVRLKLKKPFGLIFQNPFEKTVLFKKKNIYVFLLFSIMLEINRLIKRYFYKYK